MRRPRRPGGTHRASGRITARVGTNRKPRRRSTRRHHAARRRSTAHRARSSQPRARLRRRSTTTLHAQMSMSATTTAATTTAMSMTTSGSCAGDRRHRYKRRSITQRIHPDRPRSAPVAGLHPKLVGRAERASRISNGNPRGLSTGFHVAPVSGPAPHVLDAVRGQLRRGADQTSRHSRAGWPRDTQPAAPGQHLREPPT